jgi:hypothetical protein
VRVAAFISSLVAMTLGCLAFWHTTGGRITATEISVLSPVATFAAAGVALLIATRDRRERMKERDAEDEAQAKLVIVLPRRPQNPLELQILVTNKSCRLHRSTESLPSSACSP